MLPPKEFKIKSDKPYRIKKVSDKMRQSLSQYQKLRIAFLAVHSVCQAQITDCTGKATEVHHKTKRGANLNEISTFMAVCRNCHTKIENMPVNEAIEKGFRCRK